MSTFGSPGGRNVIAKPIPPERGSFPLDHDGECTSFMTQYLTCLRKARGVNQDECRMLSKSYLQCRMDRNLMAPDEMKNLGFSTKQQQGRRMGDEMAEPQRLQQQQQEQKNVVK